MTPKCVLVVEDQFLIRLMLVEALTDAGYEVIEAKDGDDALKLLSDRANLDLLVTDLQMPGCADGNAVGIFAKTRYPGLPVIYASGRQDTLSNILSEEDTFVPKPFGTQQIVVLVARLLGSRSFRDPCGQSNAPPVA